MIRSLRPRMQWPIKCDSFRFDIFKVPPKWLIRSLNQRIQWPRKGNSNKGRFHGKKLLFFWILFDIKSFRCWMIRSFLDFYKKSRNGEKIIDLDNLVLDWGSTSLSCYWEELFQSPYLGQTKIFKGWRSEEAENHSIEVTSTSFSIFFLFYFWFAEIHICPHLMLCPPPPWF